MDLTNGPLGLPGVPPLEIALPGLPALSLRTKSAYYYLVLAAVGARVPGLPGPDPLAGGPGAGGAPGERDARRLGRHRRAPTTWCWPRWSARRMAGFGGRPLRALHALREPGGLPVHLHRHDGDHGGGGREGHAGRPRGGRGALHGAARRRCAPPPPGSGRCCSTASCWCACCSSCPRGSCRPCAGSAAAARRTLAAVVTLEAHDLTVRFGGVAALDRGELRGRARHRDQPDRPERRGQDHRVQRDHRLPAADAGHGAARRRSRSPAGGPHRIAARGLVRTFQKTSVFPGAERAGERADRPAPARPRGRGRGAAGPRPRAREERRLGGGGRARDRLRRARAAPRARRPAALSYGEQRLLELAVALAARPAAAPARRAGLGHERLREGQRSRR